MDIFSQVLLAILAVMLGITALFVPFAIVRNLRQGLKFREALAQRADSLRLGRMLRALGVDLAAYLHEQPLTRIETQMRRCQECDAQAVCDDQLQGEVTVKEINFCPNQAEFAELPQSAAQVAAHHA